MGLISWLKNYQGYLMVAIALVILLVGILMGNFLSKENIETPGKEEGYLLLETQQTSEKSATYTTSTETKLIFVDVKGAVKHPGVYQMTVGQRVCDLLQKAGGMTEEAYQEGLNEAQLLQDQEFFYVMTKKEAKEEGIKPATKKEAVHLAATGEEESEKININTADLAQLTTLSGIGEKKAAAIISYREEHGPFQAIEDLQEVSGIGEKTVEKLRASITI